VTEICGEKFTGFTICRLAKDHAGSHYTSGAKFEIWWRRKPGTRGNPLPQAPTP
jgi:hypothetical protein